MSRSCTYTPEVAEEILDRLARGESLREMCQSGAIPHPSTTVRMWVVDDVQGFAARYARARNMGLDEKAEELLEIAAKPVMGERVKDTPRGREVVTGDIVERSKLHVDTLKWYLAKLAPKRYGEKLEVEHTGNAGLEERLRQGRQRVAKINPQDPSTLV